MTYNKLPLEGAYLINLNKIEDDRGFFSRFFCVNEFDNIGLDSKISQINTSSSVQKGTLRGLHFQYPPYAETKIVRCINGSIWDVIVDLRQDSKTYGKWHAEELSSVNKSMMYVPKGFAHGFISLTDNAEILYLVSEFYNPKSEDSLLWSDIDISIKWPIQPVVINEKDSKAKNLTEIKPLIIY